ncbi:hypothetical protein GEV33_009590 [Tenebrio molitor]|uniref:Reverse transcriptase domain-containing protein n=1 Tax=Tenebrio molitor TaxID=7067 RepID=A0A8J6LH65_TENMO|nr:hypothetical protein GEV33_009590 [Tenebrio molitor]
MTFPKQKKNKTRLSGYTDSGKIDLITFPEVCHGARVFGSPWGCKFYEGREVVFNAWRLEETKHLKQRETLALYSFMANGSRVWKLVHSMNREAFRPRNSEQHAILSNEINMSKMISKIFLIMCTITCSSWAISPFLDTSGGQGVRLPLSGWYPFSTDGSPAFEFAYVYQIFSTWVGGLGDISMDTCMSGAIMLISAQLSVLNNALEIMRQNYQKDTEKIRKEEEKFRQSLIRNIEHYKSIIQFADEFTYLFTASITGQFVVGVIIVCMSMFQMSLVSVLSFRFFAMMLYQICVLMEIYLWCYYGNESDKLTESAYICEWIDGPKEFKQDLLFFMTRTQFPLKLYASGYFTLSLETFKAVCLKANSNEVLIRSVSDCEVVVVLFCSIKSGSFKGVFKTTLQDMIAQHTTRVTFKRSSKKPWIDSKILKLIRKKRSLWRTFRRTGAESDYKTHRAFSNKLSTTIKEARTRYEASIANSKDTKHFHKHIRTQLSGPVGTPQVRDITGSVTDNSDVVADIFADVFSKVFTKESRDRIPAVPGPPNSTFLSDIDFLETVVCEKIRKLKVSKSPGPDLITAKVLSNCAAELSVPLSVLMKQSFRSGVLPPDWRSAIVRPIFKKGDKFDAANYRPVSLTSLVVKAMESIIYDQQHGFLPGKSIQSNLLACLADWTREVDNGNSVDVLYLDFSKAFDRVPKRRLISKLQHLGISGNLLAWINAFLSERTFCVRVGESYSRPVRVHSGVPQGSVLGPLLFIAYTADLGCILRSPFAMYADDIKVYNISNQSMALEQDLLAIHDWSCDWLLPLNSDKCGVLHIGNTNPKHIYRINGKELASFDNYRDLGVTVSFDLSWSNHILKITKKANSMLFLLNKVFRKSSPAIFAKLYKTYVRPVLEFANCVWTPVLQRDIQLLESVQRRATRVPFGISRPQYTARLSLMGIPSLSARRVRGDLLVVFRALSSEQSPIRHLFTLHEGGRTRGHSLKLLKDRRGLYLVKQSKGGFNILGCKETLLKIFRRVKR